MVVYINIMRLMLRVFYEHSEQAGEDRLGARENRLYGEKVVLTYGASQSAIQYNYLAICLSFDPLCSPVYLSIIYSSTITSQVSFQADQYQLNSSLIKSPCLDPKLFGSENLGAEKMRILSFNKYVKCLNRKEQK